MDVKTLLLLGAGMLVLSLVGFCSAQSRSASFVVAGVPRGTFEAVPAEPPHSGQPAPSQQINAIAYVKRIEAAAAPQGAKR